MPIEYYKDPKKTAETFITAPDGNRYVIPSDMATHNEDGTVTMLGRGSLCINSRGENIYPEEVEMAVKAYDDVYDCLVAATPDKRFGQCVTALIELRPGRAEPLMDDIQKLVKLIYLVIKCYVVFITLKKLSVSLQGRLIISGLKNWRWLGLRLTKLRSKINKIKKGFRAFFYIQSKHKIY